MYAEDAGIEAALMRSLLGLVDFSGNGSSLLHVQQALKRLGKHAPIFTLRQSFSAWQLDIRVDLQSPPFLLLER